MLKSSRKAPRQEKRSKKGPKTGPSRGGKMVARGWTNVSWGHFFTLRWSDVLSDCNSTHFTSFLTSKMNTFSSKSDLFLRSIMIYCSLCTSSPDVKNKKKTREFLSVSHGYGLILRCPRNGFQCFTSSCKPQVSAGGHFLQVHIHIYIYVHRVHG